MSIIFYVDRSKAKEHQPPNIRSMFLKASALQPLARSVCNLHGKRGNGTSYVIFMLEKKNTVLIMKLNCEITVICRLTMQSAFNSPFLFHLIPLWKVWIAGASAHQLLAKNSDGNPQLIPACPLRDVSLGEDDAAIAHLCMKGTI